MFTIWYLFISLLLFYFSWFSFSLMILTSIIYTFHYVYKYLIHMISSNDCYLFHVYCFNSWFRQGMIYEKSLNAVVVILKNNVYFQINLQSSIFRVLSLQLPSLFVYPVYFNKNVLRDIS